MKARKLPSGHWRVRTCVNGVRRSFTAETRQEAEFAAHAYIVGKRQEPTGMTVSQAVRTYIDDREAVLSPSTIAGYNSLAKNAYESIDRVLLDRLDQATLQRWASSYAAAHSPKRTANAYGLLRAAVTHFNPDMRVSVRLPQRTRTDAHTPSVEDVRTLLRYIKGRDRDLYVAVLLGAFVPMRRGEICGLLGADVDHAACTITVRHNMVAGEGNAYHVKAPKTAAGYRTVIMPREIMAELPIVAPDERIVTIPPHRISHRFKAAAKACGLDGVHFHSLRHFGASLLHAWSVPDAYIMARGGWQSSEIMRRIYREALDDESRRMAERVNDRIVSML